jgi:hypothetical protein
MLCAPSSKSIIDYECDVCNGTGIEPYRLRAACTHCDGLGRRYICYHDMSSFPGRDYRGTEREAWCPKHGVQEWVIGRECCCAERTVRKMG